MQSIIDIRGDFLSTTSYSMLAREIYYAFTRLGFTDIRLEHQPTTKVQLNTEQDIIAKLQMSQQMQPAPIKLHLYHPQYQLIDGGINIAWNLSNTPMPSQELLAHWQRVNVVLVSSSSLTGKFQQKVNPQLFYYCPFPVDTNLFSDMTYPMAVLNATHEISGEEMDPKPYVFGVFGTWNSRVSIMNTLRAYITEFDGVNDNVVLLLKSTCAPRNEEGVDLIRKGISDVRGMCKNPRAPKIMYMPPVMTDSDYSQVVAACDCVVTSSAWDSLHPSLHHAMAMGKTTIAPDYGGDMDFVNSCITLPVSSQEDPVYSWNEPMIEFQQRWYSSSVADLCSAMRKAYNSRGNPDAFKKRKTTAKKYIDEFCAADKVAENICNLLINSNASAVVPKVIEEMQGKISQLQEA